MAHFAQLDAQNYVLQVIVVSNADTLDEEGLESEEVGIQYCQSFFGENTTWKQTSYNNTFRKYYAGIGFFYNQELDEFIRPWDEAFPERSINTNSQNDVVVDPANP
jgi:hypothetical protein